MSSNELSSVAGLRLDSERQRSATPYKMTRLRDKNKTGR